jgi:hypothetical protein
MLGPSIVSLYAKGARRCGHAVHGTVPRVETGSSRADIMARLRANRTQLRRALMKHAAHRPHSNHTSAPLGPVRYLPDTDLSQMDTSRMATCDTEGDHWP